jgi:uncharacterized protein YndB with AHSA1/START domain
VARIEASIAIAAPVERVWEVLVDWDRQAEWMEDVRALRVLTDHREGLGVRLRIRTDIAFGMVLTDELKTTEWKEHELLGVYHHGPLYRAAGAFELHPIEDGTRLVWWDELTVPLGVLGDTAVAVMMAPLARRTFRRSLRNLKRLCEA